MNSADRPGQVPVGGRFTGRQLAQLRRLADRHLDEWTQALVDQDVPLSRLMRCGSLHTGLLQAPKPASFSGSPWPPPRDAIIELDARLVLTAGADCLSPALLDRIATATRTRLARSGFVLRWEVPIPMAVLYSHRALNEGVAVEWELCVNVEPYFETTPYWRDVFDTTELAVQRHERALSLHPDRTRDEYEALKSAQGQEFRRRLSYGLARLPLQVLPDSLQRLATNLDRYPAVKALVEHARQDLRPTPSTRPTTGHRDQGRATHWAQLLETGW